MRLAHVIGRVTLSRQDPAYKGGRFLVVQPYAKEQFKGAPMTPLAKGNSFVAYDNLGAGPGHTVGIIEGSEATAPFDNPTPVDALCAAIVDEVFYSPQGGEVPSNKDQVPRREIPNAESQNTKI